jgi:hypothetical protein
MQTPGEYACDNPRCHLRTLSPTSARWLMVELGIGLLGSNPDMYYPCITVSPFMQDHPGIGNTRHFCSWDCFSQTCSIYSKIRPNKNSLEISNAFRVKGV